MSSPLNDPDAYTSVPDTFDGRDLVDVELPADSGCCEDRECPHWPDGYGDE